MLLPRMGASQSAKHICLLLTVVSTLTMLVSAAPGDALTMKSNTFTTCASATGAWTVGVNETSGRLTFVNSNGNVVPLTDNRAFNDYKGGHCFESSSGVLYFISDYATGNLTIKDGKYEWDDDSFPPLGAGGKNGNPIVQKEFTKATTAIGMSQGVAGLAGLAVTFIAVTERNITLWNPGAQAHNGVADLTE